MFLQDGVVSEQRAAEWDALVLFSKVRATAVAWCLQMFLSSWRKPGFVIPAQVKQTFCHLFLKHMLIHLDAQRADAYLFYNSHMLGNICSFFFQAAQSMSQC